MVKIEKLNYGRGWQRIFYVAEQEGASLSVHCHSPEGTKTNESLILLEAEIYYFKFYFGNLGKYIFIFFENDMPQLIAIITVGR